MQGDSAWWRWLRRAEGGAAHHLGSASHNRAALSINSCCSSPSGRIGDRAAFEDGVRLCPEQQQLFQGCPVRSYCGTGTMLLESLDGYEAAQCIAAGGAVLALGAGGCTAYGVALAFVVFLWLAELALPHHAVKARILSPRGTPRPSSQLRKVLADAEVPEIEEQLAELGAKAPGDVQYLDADDIADLQLSPEQGSRLKSVAARAAAQP